MKRFLLFASAVFFSAVVCQAIFLARDRPLADPTGCCEQRDNPNSGNWYRNSLNFSACDQLNRTLDNNDDIFKPTGKVWWNLSPDQCGASR